MFSLTSTHISFSCVSGREWIKQRERTHFRVFSFKLPSVKTQIHVGLKNFQKRCSSEVSNILKIFGYLLAHEMVTQDKPMRLSWMLIFTA